MKPDLSLVTHELSQQLGAALRRRSWRVTTAESCTGGGVASAITEIAGSSEWFEYGFVTYANRAKESLLGVASSTLQQHGAVSEPVVQQMAEGALRAASAQLAVAISGVAGPGGGSADKPVGTVWFAWAGNGETVTALHRLDGDRERVRQQAVVIALQGLLAKTTV